MHSRVLTLAERIIRQADREHPADDVLRLALKTEKGVSQKEARELSRAVFSYFRWKGWVEPAQLLNQHIIQAIELADRFAKLPETFSDSELVCRAVLPWVRHEIEITPALARCWQSEPDVWIRARQGQGSRLARKLGHCRSFGTGALADILRYDGPEDLFRTAAFHAGEFELQDISSQAVSLMCSAAPGQTWWDACAGEGGKLLHLSDLMQNRGLIWASDRAAWRLARLKRRAARAKVFNYRTAAWDGGTKLPTKTKFDGVLVDAPCSGTGTWQRNPHARWTLTNEDLRELVELQVGLLVHAAKSVKIGGKLVYSVCSLARSETTGVVAAFENQCAGFTPLWLADPLDPASSPTRTILLQPERFGGNGMFVAAWTRSVDA